MSNKPTLWGSTVVTEVSSADPDSDTPVWVDISERVLGVYGVDVAGGRQNELVAGEPRRVQFALLNRDGALTSGNSSSPYWPWWKQGRRLRMRETIGVRTFDLFDGYIEAPVESVVTQVVGDTDSDVTVMVAAVDLLGRLEAGRTFLSTLAEHIVYEGGTDLAAYWPMDSVTSILSQAPGDDSALYPFRYGPQPVADPAAELTTLAPGDDLPTSMRFQDGHTGLTGALAITLGADDAITLVQWVQIDPATAGVFIQSFDITILETGPSAFPHLSIFYDAGSVWEAWLFSGGGLSGLITSTVPVVPDRPTLVGVRYQPSTATMELWVDDTVTSLGLAGAAPATSKIIETLVPAGATATGGYQGLMAHAQIYVGTDWGHEDFLAQREVGIGGMAGQSTGERVTAIADFAGVPAGRRDIDPGVTAMTRARLAGRKPTDLLTEAVTTEQGRLLMSGDGRLTFHDRRRLYNI